MSFEKVNALTTNWFTAMLRQQNLMKESATLAWQRIHSKKKKDGTNIETHGNINNKYFVTWDFIVLIPALITVKINAYTWFTLASLQNLPELPYNLSFRQSRSLFNVALSSSKFLEAYKMLVSSANIVRLHFWALIVDHSCKLEMNWTQPWSLWSSTINTVLIRTYTISFVEMMSVF